MKKWTKNSDRKKSKMEKIQPFLQGKITTSENILKVLEQVIDPYDKVVIEGDNQKQASFLSDALSKLDARNVNNLHIIIPCVTLPEHLDIFEKGIASKIDFSYAGMQGNRIIRMIKEGKFHLGDINTYSELYGRLFIDLIPNVVLVAADKADNMGNLYTGFNTEDTPTLIEAAAFKDGIVIVQVNEIVQDIPRVDIPGDWIDVIVQSQQPYELKSLFTRDPEKITDTQILMGMMAIKGIYSEYRVNSLNHGVGFNTAAIELLLPTYGQSLKLQGTITQNWMLNPHPTIIPAIESGWVKNIYCPGGEIGMEKYITARPDIFFVGKDGSMRSNRALAHTSGQYAIDMFIGSTLQMDYEGNSSTVTNDRLTGFGGAPNLGHNPMGRRHSTATWQSLKKENNPLARGRKIVVQMLETFNSSGEPTFVKNLDALQVQKIAGLESVPIMIYGEDITHVITEEGIAYLYKASNLKERKEALAAIAGVTPLGLTCTKAQLQRLRKLGIVKLPEDLHIKRSDAKRSLLAAQSIEDLVKWSKNLYEPPMQFRTWS